MMPVNTPLAPSPQPGLPRTIGYFNLFLGGFLLLCGAGCLSMLAPFLLRNNPLQLDPAETQLVVDEMRRQIVDDLKRGEASAPTIAEKDRLKKTRLELESKPADVAGQVDFPAINRNLPWLSRYLWADLLSGPILNGLLLASGVGLVRLKSWGRRLGIWVAVLKLVRLALLTTFLFALVIPSATKTFDSLARSDVGEALVKQAMEQQSARQGGGPAARLTARDVAKVLSAMGYGSALMNLCLGAIYPAVCLVVLTREGARLACRASRTDSPGRGEPSSELS